MTLLRRLRALWPRRGRDMEPDLRYGRLAVSEALATLDTADEWYAWLWGGDAPHDRAPPNPAQWQEDSE